MNEPRAWLAQARSDFAIGNRILQQDVNGAHCHPIAKFQQAVEKAVKGLVVALTAAEVLSVRVGRRHEVESYVSAMVRLRRARSRGFVHNAIHALFSGDIRAQIRELDALAPRWPAPGVAPSRNTEYPYQDAFGNWRAPAELNVFEHSEADAFRRLASRIVDGCARIASAVERRPR